MKLKSTKFFKHKTYLFSLFVLFSAGIFSALPAYSQIDYNYGINTHGFRIGVGAGASVLQTYWSSQPANAAAVVNLDYNTNQYFSIGLEGQFGTLVGIDKEQHYYYAKSTNVYYGGNINMKFALGLIKDFNTKNGFGDAIKRLYLGVGFGAINSSIKLTPRSDGLVVTQPVEVLKPTTSTQYSQIPTREGSYYLVPLNFGTNINLRGLWGNDRVELNPNFQYSIAVGPHAKAFDGEQPNENTTNGAYALLSLALKYKF